MNLFDEENLFLLIAIGLVFGYGMFIVLSNLLLTIIVGGAVSGSLLAYRGISNRNEKRFDAFIKKILSL